ncbi:MAG: helix-turn-helix transcriptional regulator [Cellulophaga sp.]
MSNSKTKIQQYHLHKEYPGKLQFEVYSMKEYLKRSSEKVILPHSHSFYQVLWFFNGGITHSVDFKTYDLKENTALFIAKDQVHAFDENLDTEGWIIHFNESFFMHHDVDVFLKYNIFNTHKKSIYELNQDTIEVASSYINLIQKEFKEKHRFGYEDVIRLLLKSLLISLERLQQSDSGKQLKITNHYELQFFKFKELIEDNYKTGLYVSEYASLLNISAKTLTTITKSVVSKSPSQLIAERIILQSKRDLKFTSLQVGEIAFQLGFEDVSYFIKYFKRNVGCSPRNFRARIS